MRFNNLIFILINLPGITSLLFQDGNRRPVLSYKPSPLPLDSSFHRDKNLSTTENSQHDLKPESEIAQESSTIKKDGSHRETLIEDDDAKNHTSNFDVDLTTTTTNNDSVIQNTTRKSEVEESTKKNHIIHKYHTPSKENKLNGEETLILGVATDYVTPMRHPEPSKTTTSSNGQVKVTKSSKSDEKASFATSKVEKPIEKTTLIATKTFSTSTLNIETSSSVQVIESIPTKVILRPTSAASAESNTDTKSGVNLEPSSVSDVEYTESISTLSTPTDGLPTSYSRNSATTEKSVVRPTTSIITKNTGM